VVVDEDGAPPRVLLDPSELSDDGTVSLAGWSPSRDGSLLAYGLSEAGSDWMEWRVREVATGRDLSDRLRWVKFSSAEWLPDGSGLLYGRYEPPPEDEALRQRNRNQRLCLHRLGEPQERDEVVLARPDHPDWGFSPWITRDGRWLVVSIWHGSAEENALVVRRLDEPGGSFRELLPDFDAVWRPVGSEGDRLLLHTDRDAPRGRIVAIDLGEPGPPRLQELVPEDEAVLEGATRAGQRLVAAYLRDAHARVRVFDLEGRPDHEVELPGLGSVTLGSGRPEEATVWFGYSSFIHPPSIHRHDVTARRTELVHQGAALFEPADFETSQHFVTSRDGTRVPVFLSRRRDVSADGERPVRRYGYGGFAAPVTPSYSREFLAFMERGGVLAVASLRGGGEYGKEWHDAGRLLRKQATFDDCIAAAEWLFAEGWTRPRRLALHGRSNGGLLVGAVLTQRPDLLGAALPHVGVHDMLRYHLFTIGWAWACDYGTVDDPEQLRTLLAYSPCHRVRPGTAYPPTLVSTADHDDRVVPSHSYKLAAALCEAQAGEAPILLSVTTRAGHGSGTPTRVQVEESADRLAFIEWALGMGA
jgi:prolyl oligopeptidase